MRKIAVVGSRDFPYPDMIYTLVTEWLNDSPWNEEIQIVSGRGGLVDKTAEQAAKDSVMRSGTIEPEIFPAEWKVNGVFNRRAGFERNTLIVDYADEIVAFWDGLSHGTRDTIKKALAQGKPVSVIDDTGDVVPPADWQQSL